VFVQAEGICRAVRKNAIAHAGWDRGACAGLGAGDADGCEQGDESDCQEPSETSSESQHLLFLSGKAMVRRNSMERRGLPTSLLRTTPGVPEMIDL
jgi:hypothetical protein